MKATLEFELPAEQDAYWDAINGARWREFVRHAQCYISMLRDIDKNPECREAFFALKTWLREELGNAGITHHTSKSLQDEYRRVEKFYSEQVEKHYKGQEAADFAGIEKTAPGVEQPPGQNAGRTRRQRKDTGDASPGNDSPPSK